MGWTGDQCPWCEPGTDPGTDDSVQGPDSDENPCHWRPGGSAHLWTVGITSGFLVLITGGYTFCYYYCLTTHSRVVWFGKSTPNDIHCITVQVGNGFPVNWEFFWKLFWFHGFNPPFLFDIWSEYLSLHSFILKFYSFNKRLSSINIKAGSNAHYIEKTRPPLAAVLETWQNLAARFHLATGSRQPDRDHLGKLTTLIKTGTLYIACGFRQEEAKSFIIKSIQKPYLVCPCWIWLWMPKKITWCVYQPQRDRAGGFFSRRINAI